MILCIGMIEDGLEQDILYKNYINKDNPFVLERYAVYRGESNFNACVLYLAQADELPSTFSVQDGAALICIGMPAEIYKKSSMHLIVLKDSTKLLDLANDVGRIFFEYNVLEQKLQDSVNKGRSIQYMVDQMAPYLNGNELLVCNDDFRMIGHSNKTIHLNEISGLDQPAGDGTLPAEVMTFFKNDPIFSEIRDLKEPFIYESSIFVCRAIDMNVFRQGEYVCRTIIAEDRNTFRGYESGLLQFFTGFIQLVYDLSSVGSTILPGDQLVDICVDLLNGELIEQERLEKTFLQRGWDHPGSFVCAKILPSERDYYNRTIAYFCQIYNRDIKGCCFFEYEDAIVSLINLKDYNDSLEQFTATNIETFRDGYFRIGYSNLFNNLADIKQYYFQAKIALKIGLTQSPSIWYHKFSAITMSYMKYKLTEDIGGRYLCAPEILTLYNYDRENQTELLPTLRKYIDNQMNAIKTASELFIHRSTIVYRLERIKELTGIDFKNAEEALYLNISLKLLFEE